MEETGSFGGKVYIGLKKSAGVWSVIKISKGRMM